MLLNFNRPIPGGQYYLQSRLLLQYSFYHFPGIAFTLGVVSHYLKVSDAMIGILGSISQVFASLCLTFSYKYGVWLLLVGTIEAYRYFIVVRQVASVLIYFRTGDRFSERRCDHL